MNLSKYFTEKVGIGILSTANEQGEVNGAIYAKPHIIDDTTIAFIMCDRLSHQNLQSNPLAHYLFIEDREGNHGIRLNLLMVEENQDQELIKGLSRRPDSVKSEEGNKFLVSFKVNQSLRLIGGEEKSF